jgi:hypothetical protein
LFPARADRSAPTPSKLEILKFCVDFEREKDEEYWKEKDPAKALLIMDDNACHQRRMIPILK